MDDPSLVRHALTPHWLLAMMGAPGSGKSRLARALGARLSWPVVDKDDVRDLLDDSIPDAGGLAYEIMFNIARRQLSLGLSVICDSPFAYRRCYDHAVAIAQGTDAALAVVECRCPDETTWRERIDARQMLGLPPHHTTDWPAVQAYQRRTANDAGYPIRHPHIVVNTLVPVTALCEDVIAWLERQAVR